MAQTYDLKLVVCTVGGVTLGGYGEDAAIGIEWDSEVAERKVTADGRSIYSRLNDKGMTVTVTLMQTSRAHLLLAGLFEAQHGELLGIAPPVILPLPFFLLDPSTGETIASADCVFMSRPAPSKGKTVGEVEYKLHLPNPRHTPPVANVI